MDLIEAINTAPKGYFLALDEEAARSYTTRVNGEPTGLRVSLAGEGDFVIPLVSAPKEQHS